MAIPTSTAPTLPAGLALSRQRRSAGLPPPQGFRSGQPAGGGRPLMGMRGTGTPQISQELQHAIRNGPRIETGMPRGHAGSPPQSPMPPSVDLYRQQRSAGVPPPAGFRSGQPPGGGRPQMGMRQNPPQHSGNHQLPQFPMAQPQLTSPRFSNQPGAPNASVPDIASAPVTDRQWPRVGGFGVFGGGFQPSPQSQYMPPSFGPSHSQGGMMNPFMQQQFGGFGGQQQPYINQLVAQLLMGR